MIEHQAPDQKDTGFTPGPWRSGNVHKEARVYSDAGVTLAICGAVVGTHAEADARLIAAAPDLLAALEALKEHAYKVSTDDDLWGIARDAIKKARGQ